MLIDSCGVCDRSDAEKLLGDKPKSKLGKSSLSIPCLIKQPLQPEQKGIIRKDLGDRFVVYIPESDSTVTVPKLLVYPDFSGGVGQIEKSPSKNFSPSTKSQNQTRRRKGEGSGSIHWRTVIRNGKEYQQAYYHYKLNGKKRTKYIPQKLLGLIQEAESHKLPIADLLNLLGEKNINPSKSSNTNFDEKNGSDSMFLKLYPNATFDRKSMEPKLSFFLANFSPHCEKINDHPKGFVLRGIWQHIPQCKSTVISIHRNISQLSAFKKLKSKQQFYFAQPRHIPVVWDAPVEPFKFNPQLEKGEQMPRYFVEVRAIFKDGLYVVEEMLREPTRKIPKFIKVSKKKQPSIS